MEYKINLHIEQPEDSYYPATSDSVQGLVAQGRTIAETIEIARDVVKKMLDAQEDPDVSKFHALKMNLITP